MHYAGVDAPDLWDRLRRNQAAPSCVILAHD